MPHKEFSESAVRRAARRAGLLVKKSRRGPGAYQLIDPDCNWVIAGDKFGITPDEVLSFCKLIGPLKRKKGQP